MRSLLYIVAFVFIIGWLVVFQGFHTGGAFHLLLVVAIIATLLIHMQEKTAIWMSPVVLMKHNTQAITAIKNE